MTGRLRIKELTHPLDSSLSFNAASRYFANKALNLS